MKKVLFAFITLCLSFSNLIADDDNFKNSKKKPFNYLNKYNNQLISIEEFNTFKKLDKNNDNFLSFAELKGNDNDGNDNHESNDNDNDNDGNDNHESNDNDKD
jgi:hypothetical protein